MIIIRLLKETKLIYQRETQGEPRRKTFPAAKYPPEENALKVPLSKRIDIFF